MLSRIAKHWRTTLPGPSKHSVPVLCGSNGTQVPHLHSKSTYRSIHLNTQTTLLQLNLDTFQCAGVKAFGSSTTCLVSSRSDVFMAAKDAVNRYVPSADDGVELTDKLVKVQQELQLSDSEVKLLYLSLPRLKHDQLMDQFVANIAIMLENGYSIGRGYRFYCFLLQTESKALQKMIGKPSNEHSNKTYKSVSRLMNEGMKCDNTDEYYEHIAKALDVKPEALPLYADPFVIYKIKHGFMSIYTIMEKICFLKSEGFSSAEIFDYFGLVRFHMIGLNESIKKVRTEFGELNCILVNHILRQNTYTTGKSTANLSNSKEISKLLQCPASMFLQSSDELYHYLNHLSIHNAVNTLEYLLEEGFSRTDVVACPFIIGYAKCDIATELYRLRNSGNDNILDDQQKMINALQYQLEKRKAKVQKYL